MGSAAVAPARRSPAVPDARARVAPLGVTHSRGMDGEEEDDVVHELERGEARFFVRPRVGLSEVATLDKVQRFFVLLRPVASRFSEGAMHRRLAVGKKRMPDPARREREWAYVDRVGESFDDLLWDVGPEE